MTTNIYNDYAQELAKCVLEINKLNTRSINTDAFERSLINRLYYSLYNRLIGEIEQLQDNTTANKHQQILDMLYKHSSNQSVKQARDVFEDMKKFRVWADYEPYKSKPPYTLSILISKTFNVINREKIFN